jgi:hypothetical protein
MHTASTRHPRTPDTSIGQEPTPTPRRLRPPAEDAIRAFDDFVEDCTTLACLSVLNTLAQDDGAQDDLMATGVKISPENRQRLRHALRPYFRDKQAIMRVKRHLYHRQTDRVHTPPAARAAVSAPLALPVPSPAHTGLFLKRLVEETAFPTLVLQEKFGLALPTTSGKNAPRNASVQLRLHKITCLDNTREIDKDEIAFGGVAVGPDGTVKKVNQQEVPVKFKNPGDVYTFQPVHTLYTYPLTGAGAYPLGVLFTLALCEKDSGGFSDFLQELWEAVKNHVEAILIAVGAAAGSAIGATVGGSIGTIAGPIGTVIGLALGAIVGGVVGAIINSFQDDIFTVKELSLALGTATATFGNDDDLTSPMEACDFIGYGGHYRAYYSWQLKQIVE